MECPSPPRRPACGAAVPRTGPGCCPRRWRLPASPPVQRAATHDRPGRGHQGGQQPVLGGRQIADARRRRPVRDHRVEPQPRLAAAGRAELRRMRARSRATNSLRCTGLARWSSPPAAKTGEQVVQPVTGGQEEDRDVDAAGAQRVAHVASVRIGQPDAEDDGRSGCPVRRRPRPAPPCRRPPSRPSGRGPGGPRPPSPSAPHRLRRATLSLRLPRL